MIFLLCLILLLPVPLFGQLSYDQTRQVRQVGAPVYAPDGTRVTFTLDEDIWLLDVRSGEVSQLTNAPGQDSSPAWSPDGQRLAFVSDRSGRSQIHVTSFDGADPAQLTNNGTGVRSIQWSPDGENIAYLATDPPAGGGGPRQSDDPVVIVGPSVFTPTVSFTRLWVQDSDGETPARVVSPAGYDVSDWTWFTDSQGLIVGATNEPAVEAYTDRIFSLSASGGEFTEILAPKGPFSGLSVSPDGKILAFVGSRVDGPRPHDLYIVALEGGDAENLTAISIDRPVTQYVWKDNNTFEALVETGFRNRLYAVTTSGSATPLVDHAVGPSNFSPARDGSIAYVGETATQMPELYLADTGGTVRQVTRFNDEWNQISLGNTEFIRYESSDGVEIEGVLLVPPQYRSGTRLPTIMMFHGGPIGRWADRFDGLGQMLATRGYAVFYPNIRGSTGYGHNMIDLIRSRRLGGEGWGEGTIKDVMAGADMLIERGIADPDRMAVGGWSYGGYMALWSVTQTNRFKAAYAGAPVTNIASEFGTENSRLATEDTWNLGTPYEDPEEYMRNSPVTYVSNVKTPVLLLQAEDDTSVPLGQSQEMYRGLRRYGVKTEFVLYPGAGHSLSLEKHNRDRAERVIRWYDEHLK